MINRKYFFMCKIKQCGDNRLGQPKYSTVDGIVTHKSWFPDPFGAIDEIKNDLVEDWGVHRGDITMMSFSRV